LQTVHQPHDVVGLILAAIPICGYLAIRWRDHHREWAEECFRAPVNVPRGGPYSVLDFGFLAGSDRIVASGNPFFTWNYLSKEDPLRISGHGGRVGDLDLTPDGRRALSGGGGDGKLVAWDVRAGGLVPARVIATEQRVVWAVAVSPDGKLGAAGYGDGTIHLLDLDTGATVGRLPSAKPYPGPVRRMIFLDDGRLLSLHRYETVVRLWDVRTRAVTRKFAEEKPATVIDLVVAPGGDRFITARTDGVVRTWDIASGEEVARLAINPGNETVFSIAVSPDGKYLLACGHTGDWGSIAPFLKLVELRSGRLVGHFTVPRLQKPYFSRVIRTAFSPDGRCAVSLAENQEILTPTSARGSGYALHVWRLPDEIGYWLLGTQDEK